jgi:hypothetical protein
VTALLQLIALALPMGNILYMKKGKFLKSVFGSWTADSYYYCNGCNRMLIKNEITDKKCGGCQKSENIHHFLYRCPMQCFQEVFSEKDYYNHVC